MDAVLCQLRPRNWVLVGLVSATCLMAAPLEAVAVTDSTSFAVTAGTLSFTWSNEIPNLNGQTLSGLDQTDLTAGSVGTFDVVDARGSGAGWNVAVVGQVASTTANPSLKLYCTARVNGECATSTNLDNQYHSCTGVSTIGCTLGVSLLKLDTDLGGASAFSAINGTVAGANLPTYSCNAVCQIGGDTTSRKIASAGTNAGMGSFTSPTLTSQLLMDVPAEAYATAASGDTSYQMDLDVTIVNGP